jgi:alkanesulfonate monooxygenase SsuD/methylene tetrahydromethanopterin reductase-like flavin-dependent oxidoreductase (luciferase family)
MLYGLYLPIGGECGDPRFVVELAQLAEAAGWDGVFLEDYIVYQGGMDEPTCDPWVALAAIAVTTRSLRLGTAVTPLARRRPWKVAREAAAVDQLSDGRMILGVGLGDVGDSIISDASFTHFGEVTDRRTRAEMLDEGLEVITGLWSGQPFEYRGKHFTVQRVTFAPTPVQTPRIPIWVGGAYPNRGPMRRAARWDGSMLYKQAPDDGEADMTPDDVRAVRDLAGAKPYDIAVGGRARRDDWDSERDWIAAMERAGATWWGEWIPPADRETMRAAVRRGPLR